MILLELPYFDPSRMCIIDPMHVPADVGRIPRKIESGNGFSGFTADQYKSWVKLFSISCLHGLLASGMLAPLCPCQ